MPGTKLGGQKAAATNKAKYGTDFYAKIGEIGGQLGHTGGTKFTGSDGPRNVTITSTGGTLYAHIQANYTDATDFMLGGSFTVRPVAIQ